jgi:hypothetical protein
MKRYLAHPALTFIVFAQIFLIRRLFHGLAPEMKHLFDVARHKEIWCANFSVFGESIRYLQHERERNDLVTDAIRCRQVVLC